MNTVPEDLIVHSLGKTCKARRPSYTHTHTPDKFVSRACRVFVNICSVSKGVIESELDGGRAASITSFDVMKQEATYGAA